MKNDRRFLLPHYIVPSFFFWCLLLLSAAAGAQTGIDAPVKALPAPAAPKPQPNMQSGRFNFTSFPGKIKTHENAWRQYNDSADYTHPEFGLLPGGAPENCVEILSKRKADERFFRSVSDPKKVYQQKALGDLHMLIDNRWVSIDHRLKPAGAGKYTSGHTLEPVSIDVVQKEVAIHTLAGKIAFNNWKLLVNKNGQTVRSVNASWANYTIGEDGMYITDLFKGIDAELKVFRGSVKTNFIIKSNEYGDYDELVFRDEFNDGRRPQIRFTDNATQKRGIGQLTVYTNDRDALKVDAGVAYAKDTKTKTINLDYAIDEKWMDVIVPAAWIRENIGSHELIVDPLVTASNTLAQAAITGSRYNGSCNFTNSCDYTLNVTQPASTTITNISWSFTYTANGSTCWKQDGAVRITSAGCTSPSTAGYYWFCNVIGGGNCAANNISIYNDLRNCMPAPSCNTQAIPFTLQFYRACWGATGCSNSCIGAGSPWTMTLECETFGFDNVATPIVLPATTTCQGLTLPVSTAVKGGTAPYTYSWSLNASGTPVAATGSPANITFPAAGSHTIYATVKDACNNSVTASVTAVVSEPVTATQNMAICTGQLPYTWNGQTITAGGNAVATYTTPSLLTGCDSTVTLNLTVRPLSTATQNITICASQLPYTWNGQTITAGGNAVATYTTPSLLTGCDSTVTLNLTVRPLSTATQNITICASQLPYTWNGQTITAGGNAVATYTTPSLLTGCDSTVTLNLTVRPLSTATQNITICASQLPYTWNGQTITAGGNAVATFTTPSVLTGCDSTVTLNLTVRPLSTATQNITICASQLPYTWNGQTITAGGNAVATFTTPSVLTGCDSTVTLNLTIQPTPAITSQTGNTSIYIGNNTSISVTASGAGPLSYQWQVNNGSGFTNVADGGAYSGAATTTLNITNAPFSLNGYRFRCMVTGICAPPATSTDVLLTVSKQPQTITLPSPANGSTVTYTYGDNPFSAAATATSGLPVSYSSSNTAVAAIDAGGQIVIKGAGTTLIAIEQVGDAYYAPAPSVLFTVQVNKKDLYVRANDQSRPYGEANPALTITYTGFVNGENESVITAPVPNTSVVPATNPGTYPITVQGGAASNYNLITTNGVFTVTGAIVYINKQPVNQDVCEGTQASFTATATAASPLVTVAYQWQESDDANSWQDISGATRNAYNAQAANTLYIRCLVLAPGTAAPTQAAVLKVNPLPTLYAAKSNDVDCHISTVKLSASGALRYTWTPVTGLSNPAIANPVATPVAATTYKVTGTDAHGCTNTDSVRVELSTVMTGVHSMANAFTPNGDGRNDCFGTKYWGAIERVEFHIYNRSGQRIFSSNTPGACWDGSFHGQPQPAGTYVYMIRAVTHCGIIERKGTVTLVR